jgi:hypothetical protein
MNYYIIQYSRHNVPIEIARAAALTLQEASSASVISIDSFNVELYKHANIYSKQSSNSTKDLYMNLISALNAVPENVPVFLAESDIAYPAEHFESGLESIAKEPSFIHSNKNFLQQVSSSEYRKYPNHVHIFSSLSGMRDILIYHINEKIKEIDEHGAVAWLEPGYHRNGRTYFMRYKSEFPAIESRHTWNSTQLGAEKSGYGALIEEELSKNSQAKIGVMCPLRNFQSTYSVAQCVYDQLHLLARYYSEICFITAEDFRDFDLLPSNVVVKTIGRFSASKIDAANCNEYIVKNTDSLQEVLSGLTALITHDIIFIESFVPYNALLRQAGQNINELKYVHYIHSAPSVVNREKLEFPNILNREPMRNSRYVCLNKHNVDLLSQMYLVDKSEIVYIPNVVDPCNTLNMHPLSKEIYYKNMLWEADVICAYPARLVKGKQPDKIIRLLGEFANSGLNVRFVYLNSYNSQEESKQYKTELIDLAKQYGIEKDIIFTSDIVSAWAEDAEINVSDGMPHQVVIDMLNISDLFVLPSVSEGCSLIMLEAALTKNCIILNDDLETLKDFGGNTEDNRATYVPFGSVPVPRFISYKDKIWATTAKNILNAMHNDTNLNFFRYVRKFHSPDYVFKHLLEQHLH